MHRPRALPGRPASLRFRPAIPADAPSIRRLVWKARMNPLGLDPAHFLVADDDGQGDDGEGTPSLAAIGQVVRLPSSPSSLEIRSLVVAEGRRGRGLGSALLAALLASTPPTTDAVWLTALACRAPFYQRAGFEVVASGGGALGGLWGGGGGGGRDVVGDASSPTFPIPPSMRFEVLAGSVLGPLLGGGALVVMCRKAAAEVE